MESETGKRLETIESAGRKRIRRLPVRAVKERDTCDTSEKEVQLHSLSGRFTLRMSRLHIHRSSPKGKPACPLQVQVQLPVQLLVQLRVRGCQCPSEWIHMTLPGPRNRRSRELRLADGSQAPRIPHWHLTRAIAPAPPKLERPSRLPPAIPPLPPQLGGARCRPSPPRPLRPTA
eukprot:scaffold1070_cov245-Pinguiococcus_pyrenoidosus.AAC.43